MQLRSPRRILVTGGCGFIGSALIRFLTRVADVERIVNLDALTYAASPDNVTTSIEDPRYMFVRADIADQAKVMEICTAHRIDTIVHCAAESHVDRSILSPLTFVETNVMGTARLLEAVRAQPEIHFHHVSTDEVFGSLGPIGSFREDTPYAPNSPYSASKAASDHFVRAYSETYGLSTTISNCSNNYGPYQFPEKLIPRMICNALARNPLPVYGDGSNVRDWLYVDDHIEALWAILTRGRSGQTYNIGGRCERSNLKLLHELLDEVAKQTDSDTQTLRRLITFVEDRPGHDQRYAIDCTKIETLLGWRPRLDLEQGLAATVRWYLSNTQWLERARCRASSRSCRSASPSA